MDMLLSDARLKLKQSFEDLSLIDYMAVFWLCNFLCVLMIPSRALVVIFFQIMNVLSYAYAVKNRHSLAHRDLLWPLAYFALCLISVLYSLDINKDRIIKIGVEIFSSLGFFMATSIVFANLKWRETFLRVASVIVGSGALINLLYYLFTHNFNSVAYEPMIALSVLKNTNALGMTYAISGLLLLYTAFRQQKWLEYVAFLIVFALIVLTYGRISLGGIVISSCVLMWLQQKNLRCVLLHILCMSIVYFLINMFAMYDGAVEDYFQKGTSSRLEIWAATIEHIKNAPLYGHGIATRFYDHVIAFGYPHNLLLSLLYYTGLCGVFLFLMTVLTGLKTIRKHGELMPLVIAVFVLWGLFSLVEGGKTIDGSGGYGLYFWMPLSLLFIPFFKKENP